MYLHHFGLKSDPFGLDPNLDYIFTSKGHEEAIAHLVYGLEQGENFVMITGAIGTGKTLALHYLMDQIIDSFRVVLVNVTQLEFRELLKFILNELGLEYDRQGDRADLLFVLKAHLEEVRQRQRKILVIVDEAQNLDNATLEGLRLLSNLSLPGPQALQIVIAGQPDLERRVAGAGLEQLDQRIRIRYRLENLSVDEVGPYIAFRIQVAGGDPAVFTAKAIAEIYRRSRGVPRLVNQYAGEALLAAYVEGQRRVKAEHVQDREPPPEPEDVGAAASEEPAVPEPPEPRSILKNKPPVAAPLPARDPEPARRPEPAWDPDSSWFARERRSIAVPVLVWALVAITVLVMGFYLVDRAGLFASTADQAESPLAVQPATLPDEGPANPVVIGGEAGETADGGADASAEDPAGPEPKVAGGSEAAGPEAAATQVAPVLSGDPDGEFAVHVASFDDAARAERQVARLVERGYNAFHESSVVDGRTWIRVYFGYYPDRDAALAAARDLERSGVVPYFKVTRAPEMG